MLSSYTFLAAESLSARVLRWVLKPKAHGVSEILEHVRRICPHRKHDCAMLKHLCTQQLATRAAQED
jgi:hypothetical protein